MSQATSLSGMAQQLSLSIGVGAGAFILHLTAGGSSDAKLSAADFMPAFFAIGAIAMLAALAYRRLPADAGREISGHRRAAPIPPETSDLRAGE
jgi:glucose uptake protein GlcU